MVRRRVAYPFALLRFSFNKGWVRLFDFSFSPHSQASFQTESSKSVPVRKEERCVPGAFFGKAVELIEAAGNRTKTIWYKLGTKLVWIELA
jgi:hypothetical protein